MAKSGLNAMTVALADAFGPKVRVNCILPGAILTDISKAWSEETIANAHKTPMGRAGYAEDFPGAALFFASDGVGVDHRHVPARRRRRGPPAGAVAADGRRAGRRTTSSGCSPTTPPSSACPTTGPPTVRREFVRRRRRPPAQRAGVGRPTPPELVFLHGGAQNAHTWDTVALALGRPLVAIDLPGHGHSDGGTERPARPRRQRRRRRRRDPGAGARRQGRRRHVARRDDDARAGPPGARARARRWSSSTSRPA